LKYKDRYLSVLTIGLPIIGGMLSQNILNLIDTAMVGQLGSAALAGVGLGGFIFFMATAFLQGLSTGVQSISARRVGEGRKEEALDILNHGIYIALILGVPLTILLYIFTEEVFPLFNNSKEVIDQGIPYLKTRMISVFAIALMFCFRGYWSAIKETRFYFYTIVFTHIINIILNYLLIFGKFGFPKLASEGAGISSAIASILGVVLYFIIGYFRLDRNKFMDFKVSLTRIINIMKLSFPGGVQLFSFATGLTIQYKIIGMIGTLELAASNIIVTIALVAILPALGLGVASATLVGQSLGKEDIRDAENWGWDTVKLGVFLISFLSIIGYFFAEPIVSTFTKDLATIQISILPMKLVAASLWFDSVGIILIHSHFGAGDTIRTSIISFLLQWIYFLPIIYIGVLYYEFNLVDLWLAQISYRCLQSIIYMIMWKKGDWKKIKV